MHRRVHHLRLPKLETALQRSQVRFRLPGHHPLGRSEGRRRGRRGWERSEGSRGGYLVRGTSAV